MTEEKKATWQELSDEAALWLARLDSGSAKLEDFEAWRDADPRRAVAFAQIAGALATLDRVKPGLKPLIKPSKPRPSRRGLLAAAGLLIGTTAGGALVFEASTSRASVRTAVGEQKSVLLPGGGTLRLNTDSAVKWRSSSERTDIWLQRGEVAIDLGAVARSCTLRAAGKVATLAHAKVNARLRGEILDLAVMDGVCTLQNEAGYQTGKVERSNVTQIAEKQAVVASTLTEAVRPLTDDDIEALAAWPQGELLFQGQTLEAAIGEYNRYLIRKIVIADPALDPIRLGGRFTNHDPSSFLQALHASFGIRVVDDGVGTIALTK